jgi:hypothetical protein
LSNHSKRAVAEWATSRNGRSAGTPHGSTYFWVADAYSAEMFYTCRFVTLTRHSWPLVINLCGTKVTFSG